MRIGSFALIKNSGKKYMERDTLFMEWKLSTVKMSVVPQLSCRFNTNPIPEFFVCGMKKPILKFISKGSGTRKAKTVLQLNSKVAGLLVLDFKIF